MLPRVQHLLFDSGGLWAPRHEEEFLFLGRLRSALALVHILEVVKAVAAFVLASGLQVLEELAVLLVSGSDHFHIDLHLILDVEDDVAMFLFALDFFVGRLASV